MPLLSTPIGLARRRRPQLTRSITVNAAGPNRPVEGRLIPWPEVPAYPVLTDLSPLLSPKDAADRSDPDEGLLSIGRPLFTTAGRTALGWAVRSAGLVRGDRVLLPAYHCLVMLDHLAWFGLEAVFYRLNEDLSIDYDDLRNRLSPGCKALIAVHYFGFPQDGPRLRAFCDEAGLALVEDCAHSFFGAYQGKPLGSFGNYAVGSLPKFLPLRAGGCLVSSRHPLPKADLADQGRTADLQALTRELQIAQYYGHLRAYSPLTLFAAASAKLLSRAGFAPDPAVQDGNADSLEFSASRVAKRTLRSCKPKRLSALRRRNYETICELLSGVPGIELLKPDLEPGVVPYMVPLRIPALRKVFARLEDGAVPMQRFGQFLAPGLDPALCPVSTDLSLRGLQLPCHQSLRDEEIAWMADRLSEVCASGSG